MVDFIKTDSELVLFIDSSEGHLSTAQKLLTSYEDFKGVARSFTTGRDALNFLKTIKSSDGQTSATADLIFMTFSVQESQGLKILEQVIDLCEN